MAAEGRKRRVPGGDPILDNANFRNYVIRILDNDPTLGCLNGRLLRLKPDLCPDATSVQLDIVIDALKENWRVEVLYIQNFEKGFGDRQLAKLMSLLKQGRIWALNVGENFAVSLSAWADFTAALPETLVSYIYVSEHKLRGTDLKNRMRTAIRYNRKVLGPRDPVLCANVTNMWFNPPAPGRCTAGQPLTIDAASDPEAAPSTAVVAARRKRDLERIESRRRALSAAGMPPPRTPDDTAALQPTVANLKRFNFLDYLEVPARVRVTPLPAAPLHPAAAACIAYMHHTISSTAAPVPSALEVQAGSAICSAQEPGDGLQILPLALPVEYVEKASGSPRSGTSSAFRLDCGLESSDVLEHGANVEVHSPDGRRLALMAHAGAPAACQAEPTRRSKRTVKKRMWADESGDEASAKPAAPGRRGKKTRPPLSASGRARRAIQTPARFAAS